MGIQKEEIYRLLDKCLNEGDQEDLDVLYSLLEGLALKQKEKPNSTYLTSLLKMRGELTGNTYTITIPIQLLIHNSINIVHGGITATIADTAMGILVNKSISSTKVAVTSELKMNYISPGIGEHISCEAKIIHLGNRTSVTEARLYADGKLIAFSSGTFFILPRN
jgi:uncharacterized protein (TIGR00369 family)